MGMLVSMREREREWGREREREGERGGGRERERGKERERERIKNCTRGQYRKGFTYYIPLNFVCSHTQGLTSVPHK